MTLSLISRFNVAQEEPLTGLAPESVYITEKLNEQYSLNAQVMLAQMNEAANELLQQENYIRVSSTGQTYRIKTISKVSRRRTPVLDLSAEHVFFDIIDVKQDKATAINESATFARAMDYALTGTGWSWQIINGQFYAKTYENFQGNALDLFKRLQSRHDFEWYPDSRNMTVYIYESLGYSTEAQLRYNHNLISITDKTSTTELVNCRKGYGKKKTFTEEDPEPPILQDSDYLCTAVWKDAASVSQFGERWGDDYENENYTIEENLEQALADMSEPWPVVSLSLSFAQLGEFGDNIDNDTANLGNTVYIIHEPLGLDVNARIVARKIYPETTRKSPELTLSNILATSVSQSVKLRQDVAELVRDTNTQLARIGSIGQATGEIAGDVEGLAGNVETLANNVASLAQIVDGFDSQLDESSGAVNSMQTKVDNAQTTANDAQTTANDAQATANDAQTLANQLNTKVSGLLTNSKSTLATNNALTGSLSVITTGAECFISGELSGSLATTEAVCELPKAMALPTKAGQFVYTTSSGGSGVETYQVRTNKLYLLTANRAAADSLLIDFSYRY